MGLWTGSFVFVVQFFDTRTGRVSPVSARLWSYYRDPAGRVAYLQNGTTTATNGVTIPYFVQVTFPMLYMIYDTTRFDTMMVYRAQAPTAQFDTNGNLIAPDLSKVSLALDAIVTLADRHVADEGQPADPDWKVAGIFMRVDDVDLISQPTLDDSQVFLENMPPGGAGYVLESLLYLGNFNAIDTTNLGGTDREVSGLGVIRWSSPMAQGVESFQALDRYFLEQPAEEVLTFKKCGPNVMALTRRAVYLVRRESYTVKAMSVHGGMGVANYRAACTVASEVRYVSRKGVKSIDSQGKLSEIMALNALVKEAWRPYLSELQMAYDEDEGMTWVYCPSLNQAAIVWDETSKVTELHDVPALYVAEGVLPADPTSAVSLDNPLTNRATFVHEVQSQGGGQTFWRLTCYDSRRQKTRKQLMDCGGPSRWALSSNFAGGTDLPSGPWSVGDRPEGSWLYVLDGPEAGAKARVVRRGAGNNSLVLATALPALTAGTRVGLSPVYFRWVGALANVKGDENGMHRYARVHRIDSLQTVFTDVSGSAVGNSDAAWRGLVYKGNGEDALVSAFPYSRRDKETRLSSVTEGPSDQRTWFKPEGGGVEGAMLCPGVEVFCPDLDFNLLEVTGDGEVLPYETEAIGR